MSRRGVGSLIFPDILLGRVPIDSVEKKVLGVLSCIPCPSRDSVNFFPIGLCNATFICGVVFYDRFPSCIIFENQCPDPVIISFTRMAFSVPFIEFSKLFYHIIFIYSYKRHGFSSWCPLSIFEVSFLVEIQAEFVETPREVCKWACFWFELAFQATWIYLGEFVYLLNFWSLTLRSPSNCFKVLSSSITG
jgi:hypothetical protein